MTAYTLGNVARICRVKPARLRYWKRTSLLNPSGEIDRQPAFEFGDIVSVRSVLDLLDRGVPLRRIRKSAEDLQSLVPELARPLGALREWIEGSGRMVVRHEGVLVQPNGQTVLDFDPSPRDEQPVAVLSEHTDRRDAEPSNRLILARQHALDWFERGCKLDSDRATHADAIEAYHKALEADPDFADAHCNLGSVYFNQDRRATARRCFEQAIEIEPQHVEANLNLASLLEEEGLNHAALHRYKTALASDPLYADTHVSLALLYEKLKLASRGLEHWRRYLQLDPEGAWADLAHRRLDH